MSLARTYRGLRVLDLSENIAGPLACLVLALVPDGPTPEATVSPR